MPVAINITGKSTNLVCLSIGIGKMRTVAPKTRAMFAMFEPITLPTAIPALSFKALVMLTINSGADVPNATIVIPITKGEIFTAFARATAPLTRNSPPKIKTIKPTRRKRILINIICSRQR